MLEILWWLASACWMVASFVGPKEQFVGTFTLALVCQLLAKSHKND